MKTKSILTFCIALAFSGTAFAAGADDKAVRDADAAWSKAAGAKDLDKTVSVYGDDAIVLPPNEAAVTSKDGIRNLWKGFMDGVTVTTWNATTGEMAK